MTKWGLWRFLRVGCHVVFWPLVLVFVGGFPIRQGVVLGLLMAWLAFGIATKPVCRFIPYWVRVSPNWYQILTDLKLISSPEEWRSIAESVRSSTGYHVLRDGVLFTVVQQGGGRAALPEFNRRIHVGWQETGDFEHALIFWNQHQTFGCEFRFGEDMTPIQFERTEPIDKLLRRGPLPAIFFMGPHYAYTTSRYGPKYRPEVFGGLDLGMVVPVGWWEKSKDSCTALGLVVHSPDAYPPETGSVRLTLATLPLSEFTVYRDSGDRGKDEYYARNEPQSRKRRDEARQKLGWADILDGEAGGLRQIEHRYFSIQHGKV